MPRHLYPPIPVGTSAADSYLHVAKRQIQRRIEEFSKRGKCDGCWLLKTSCVCPQIQKVDTYHEYIVYMHQLEYLRASNTGKLLQIADPKTRLYIAGHEDHEKEFFELLQKRGDRVLCLYPSTDSISLDQFLSKIGFSQQQQEILPQQQPQQQNGTPHTSNNINKTANQPTIPPLTICVLDGTWRQAKGMNARLPSTVPKVHLPLFEGGIPSLLSPARKQSTPDRICTLQAMVMAMQFFQEDKENTCDPLIKGLKTFLNSLLKQNGRRAVYDVTNADLDAEEVTRILEDAKFLHENNNTENKKRNR